MLTIVTSVILGFVIAGIIAIRKKHKLVLVVTAELMVGLMTGFIVGFAVSMGIWQVLPKDYVLIENINLMRMNNQEPKCFVAKVQWRKNENSMYMFLRKDMNGKPKFDMIPITKTAYPHKEQREDGLIKVYENKSKVYHLFTLASDFRYGIFIPEDSIILTSK